MKSVRQLSFFLIATFITLACGVIDNSISAKVQSGSGERNSSPPNRSSKKKLRTNSAPKPKSQPSKLRWPSVELIYTKQRKEDAINAARRLKNLGIDVELSETSDFDNKEAHMGKIYYPNSKRIYASRIADIISDIEGVSPSPQGDNDYWRLTLWIIKPR